MTESTPGQQPEGPSRRNGKTPAREEGGAVALYAAGHVFHRVRPHIRRRVVVCEDDWPGFEHASRFAACGVIAVERLDGDPVVEGMRSLKIRRPEIPLVLVTGGRLEGAKSLGRLVFEELVCIEEVEEELGAAIERAANADFLGCLAQALQGEARIPELLRSTLVHICQADPWVQTVNQAARWAGCPPRALQRQWRSVVGATAMRLKDFVCWVLLIRASASRSSMIGSFPLAYGSVRTERLHDISHRLTDRPPGFWKREGKREIEERFAGRLDRELGISLSHFRKGASHFRG